MATGNEAQKAVAGLSPLTSGGTAGQGQVPNVGNPINPLVNVIMRLDPNGPAQQWNISTAKNSFSILPQSFTAPLIAAMDKAYGKGNYTHQDLIKGWQSAVDQSAQRLQVYGQQITPDQIFTRMLGNLAANGLTAGGTAIGNGAGGTSRATQKSVNLTDPSTARGLIDNALSQHLGRQANPQEQAAFLKALNVQQQASPTITEQTTTTSGRNSSSTSQTTGGFNASTFADEYAAGQQGAGEFQAATTLLDSFIGALGAKV